MGMIQNLMISSCDMQHVIIGRSPRWPTTLVSSKIWVVQN
jgi:hypothetical protein